MHRLEGAYERVIGARERLEDLKPEIRDFGQVIANSVSLQYEYGPVIVDGRLRQVPIGRASSLSAPTPPRLSRLIGEVIQNLRTALEYLIYELTCYYAKAIVDNTQFPVADTEEDFRELLGRYHLKALIPEHIAALQQLQPFKGCYWMKRLVELSNPDKHRHLTAARSSTMITIDPQVTQEILAGGHVEVQRYATIQVAVSDGPLVLESLEQLCSMVAQTLDAFKPEFQ